MRLTIRDGVNTVLAAGAGGMLWANHHYADNTFWGSNRWTMTVIALLTVLMASLAADLGDEDRPAWYATAMGILAFVGVATAAVGLAFGSYSYAVAVAGIAGATWLIATVWHTFEHAGTHTHVHGY